MVAHRQTCRCRGLELHIGTYVECLGVEAHNHSDDLVTLQTIGCKW